MASVNENARDIQRQIVAIQDKQVSNFKDVVLVLSDDMKAMQKEAHNQHQAETKVLQNMARELSRSLVDLKEETNKIQFEINNIFKKNASKNQKCFI